MGISKRKWISLILCFALLVGVFSTYNVKAEEKPLRVLLDVPQHFLLCQAHQVNLRGYLKYLYGESFADTKLEYLPWDKTERELRIKQLRVEMMAGGGPDVFLMFSYPPSGDGTYPEHLFLDPRKAMERGLFYPLDQYIPTAQSFHPELFLEPALKAGRTEEGQMILPIALTFPVMIYQKDPEDLEKAKECAFGGTASTHFSHLLGELADYSNQKLLFTKEELLETTKRALAAEQLAPVEEWYSCTLEKESLQLNVRKSPLEGNLEGVGEAYYSPQKTGGLLSVQSLERQAMAFWGPDDCYAYWAAHNGEPGFGDFGMRLPEDRVPPYPGPQEIAPVYNMRNGVTAEITAYICVNRNTKRPDDAFKVVDFMYNLKMQNQDGETEGFGHDYIFDVFPACWGLPARNDLLKNHNSGVAWHEYIGSSNPDYLPETDPEGAEKLFSVYTNLRDEITTARFYGSLDEELQNMFNQCREADSDEEIEKLVSRAYETMTIMLGE